MNSFRKIEKVSGSDQRVSGKPAAVHFQRGMKIMMVNFVVCGTQKGGTTALDAYLREHPQICMADKKRVNNFLISEVHFFDNESWFNNPNPDYSRYHAGFSPNPSHKLLGETTPIYMYWHDAPRRIWQYNSDMKLIVLLRNPIERAYSHWNMERSRNTEHLPFWDAVRDEQNRCREALPYQHEIYSYVDRGFYLAQLRRLWFYFSKKNVLVLKSEYLKNQPNDALKEICGFLGVEHFADITPKEVHSVPYLSRMSNNEKEYLRFVFEHEIKGLERVLDWDCGNWLSE